MSNNVDFTQFKDRQSVNPNRRKLKIVSQSPDEIVVDVERADGIPSEVGTPLNAQSINSRLTEIKDDLQSLVTQKTGSIVKVKNAQGVYEAKDINFDSDPQTQINALLDKMYPIGSLYMSTNSTNPAVLFGGSWESYAEGRTIFGAGTSDQTFTAGTNGGESKHLLTINEMPSHSHIQNAHTHTATSSTITGGFSFTDDNSPDMYIRAREAWGSFYLRQAYGSFCNSNGVPNKTTTNAEVYFSATPTISNNSTIAVNQNTGGNALHNNLPPYIVAYIWRRIA